MADVEKNGIQTVDDTINSLVGTLETFVKTEVSKLADRVSIDLQSEVNDRQEAIKKVNNKIDLETQYRIGDVDEESYRAKQAENELSQSILQEQQRAEQSEGLLSNSINTEKQRAENQEQALLNRSKVIASWSDSAPDGGISLDEVSGGLLYDEKLERVKSVQELNNRINSVDNESKSGDLTLTTNLNSEISERQASYQQLSKSLEQEISARVQQDNLQVKLNSTDGKQSITGGVQIDTLDVTGETVLQGSVTTYDQTIYGDVVISKSINTFDTEGQASGGNLSIQGKVDVQEELTLQSGATINGSLLIKGATQDKDVYIDQGVLNAPDMVVKGNLTILGETITETQKTLEIDDNIIVTRANATETPSTPTGVVMSLHSKFDGEDGNRTDNHSMGIVYNPSTDSVDLSLGKLEENDNGGSKFIVSESNPIVIRPNSPQITNGNIVSWEKQTVHNEHTDTDYINVRAVDSGVSIDKINQIGTDLVDVGQALQTETNRSTQKDQELDTAILNEAGRAQQAEETLQVAIQNEASAARLNEQALELRIDTIDGQLFDEQQTRESTDNELNSRLSVVENDTKTLSSQMSNEVTDRQNGDKDTLDQSKYYTDLETTRAVGVETNLQQQIDDLTTTIKDEIVEDMSEMLDEIQQNTDVVVKLQKHEQWAVQNINNLDTAIQSEALTREQSDKDIRNDVAGFVEAFNNMYTPIKEFYDSMGSAYDKYGDRMLVATWDETTHKAIWQPMDDGELN